MSRYKRRRKREFSVRRWLSSASPRQLLLVVFGGGPIAFVTLSILMPYLLAGAFVVAILAGMFLMKFGGVAIGVVSLLDRTESYDAPVWFSIVKWGTFPLRLVDSALSVSEFLFDGEYEKENYRRERKR